MTELNEKDLELIGAARRAITANYDGERYMHTVGAAVRAAGGKIYVGIDVYSIHGACAELVALGAAMTAGEREFTHIVAVRGPEGAGAGAVVRHGPGRPAGRGPGIVPAGHGARRWQGGGPVRRLDPWG